ncbi:MAG TPA: PAS domain-containing protein [Actinomycetota bacterium]|nr:PAS domain-containing protein [Actinomycetota bacterium]
MDARLEASAPDREGLLERVFLGSTLGMAVCRLEDGRFLEANEAFCYLVGRGIGELLGVSVFDMGLFETIGERRARELLETRGVLEGFDASLETPSGETRFVRFWAETLQGEDPLVVVRASDVDGRATAGSRYHEMREAEIRYRALVENIPAITYTQAEDPSSPTGFRDVYISPQTTRILGYTPEDWHADPTLWVTATHPDDRARVMEEDRRAAAHASRFQSEYRMIARDGRTVWFRDEAAVVEDPLSGLSFWQGVMLDITEEKRLAEAGSTSEAKYRTLVETLPAIVYLGEYGDQGDWLYISPQLEHVLGYTPQEWLAHPGPMNTFTHPDDLPAAREAEERSLATGEPYRAEYRMQAKDGRWVWILDEASVVRDELGRPLFMQGIMYDITDRKRAEERLLALDRLKNTLLHTLSHDLKEPLTAILGAASTLERLDDELTAEERTSLLGVLANRTRGMSSLLTDLLDLDRLDRGIAEPRRFPVDLGALATELVRQTHVLRGRAVELDVCRCVGNVDAPKVERMLENLLSNAVRYSPREGRIWLRVREAEGGALLVVEDEGPGVPDELKTAIFEPFQRGHESSALPGTGIGLSLVARFAEIHGGRAWVEDRPGGGASFRILLPDADPGDAD